MEEAERTLFARGIRDAVASSSGASLDAALADLGWLDAFEVDPQSAVSVFFECQGASNVTSSALDRIFIRELGLEERISTAVVLPTLRSTEPPGSRHSTRWIVRGLALGPLASSDTALVIVGSDVHEPGALFVDVEELAVRQVAGLDPSLGVLEVTGDIDAGRHDATRPITWDGAIALGQLALGYELVGAARTMLEMARQHALGRVQFGRTISSFQAVRHRLAESLVAVDAASSLLEAAWRDPVAYGAMAKAFAGRNARLVSRHCQQVLAGIGFTTEHPFQHYVRRVLVLDQLLGAGTVLTRDLGAHVLDTGSLPPAFPL